MVEDYQREAPHEEDTLVMKEKLWDMCDGETIYLSPGFAISRR